MERTTVRASSLALTLGRAAGRALALALRASCAVSVKVARGAQHAQPAVRVRLPRAGASPRPALLFARGSRPRASSQESRVSGPEGRGRSPPTLTARARAPPSWRGGGRRVSITTQGLTQDVSKRCRQAASRARLALARQPGAADVRRRQVTGSASSTRATRRATCAPGCGQPCAPARLGFELPAALKPPDRIAEPAVPFQVSPARATHRS